MKVSRGRFLATHVGSLPRPNPSADGENAAEGTGAGSEAHPRDLTTTVTTIVQAQIDAGLDVVNDGEMAKPSYVGYVTQRLTGFGGPPQRRTRRAVEEFPEYARRQFGDPELARTLAQPSCDGPVSYAGRESLDRDLAGLKAATADREVADVFMTAASPGVIEMFMPNRYYPSESEYLAALADAMKEEYDTIVAAGFLLQLDCPDLAAGWEQSERGTTLEQFRHKVARRVELIDHATRDIPPDRMRMHVCWGNYEGPHHHDLPLIEIIDLVLRARPAGLCVEAANPRHEHEWEIFTEVDLPDDKVLVPGVVDTTTNYIEHPELVAQRIRRYADVVGPERVIAGTDCGFASFAAVPLVDPKIAWAKLGVVSEGAKLASHHYWTGG
ncbi:cobalamin-independent methionine synthase II family protein [Actinoallomurus purpureus]|uniref:cobalamin-independent methionine synthase II family protein n=1 Tax=Actinoallomurus purpureus TaxID=478114 RepID=UPI002092D4C5|nr:cobalamin-independent methionine synthase II family protein [Actinoallomurus purpureus]MCO6008421.1 cobalamin-independent methionine synthase II family protein [Actinoallomurus purpureus]